MPHCGFDWFSVISCAVVHSAVFGHLLEHTHTDCSVVIITSDKGGGKCVCLSVCLLARILKNACMDLYEMLHVDRFRDMDELINFWARSHRLHWRHYSGYCTLPLKLSAYDLSCVLKFVKIFVLKFFLAVLRPVVTVTVIVQMPELDCFLWYRMHCNTEFYYVGKILRIGIGRPSLQRGMVLFTAGRGNTFVGGTCALPSALLVGDSVLAALTSAVTVHQSVCLSVRPSVRLCLSICLCVFPTTQGMSSDYPRVGSEQLWFYWLKSARHGPW